MTVISRLSLEDLVDLQNKIAEQAVECATLEDAAQEYMSILYEALSESIVLARLFATIPFEELPKQNKEFVMNLARSGGTAQIRCCRLHRQAISPHRYAQEGKRGFGSRIAKILPNAE